MTSERIEKHISFGEKTFNIYFKDASDWMTQHSIRQPVYEPEVTEYLLQNLKRGMTFLDVGAGIGWFTLIGAHEVGFEGRVYAYEPLPSRFELLKENVELNGYENVQCFSLALSDREGQVYMGGGNRMRLTGRRTDVPVKTVRLDSHFEALGLKQVDAVKIDVEGGELLTLLGMKRIIKNNPAVKIVCEVHRAKMLSLQNRERLFHFMSGQGFHVEELGGVPPHYAFHREKVEV